MQPRSVPWAAVAIVCALLVGVAAYLTVRSLALADDGALYLIEIVRNEDVVGRPSRFLTNAVRQAPVLAGVKLGVTDTQKLTVLLGIGQLVVPALVWSAAVVLARSDRLAFSIVVVAAGVCAGMTSLFSVGEGTLTVPLTVLASVLLWQPRPWPTHQVLLVLGATVILVQSHETTIFTSLLLVAWGAARALRAASVTDRWVSWMVAVLSAITIAHSARELFARKDDPPAKDLVDAVLALIPLELYVGLVAGAFLLAALALPLGRPWRPLLFTLSVLGAGAMTYSLVATDGDPYRARGGAAIVTIAVSASLFVLWRGGATAAARSRAPAVSSPLALWLPIVFAALPLLALVPRGERWADSFGDFRQAVIEHEGIVPVENVLPPGSREVLFDWTSSALSVVVRDRPDAAVLVDSSPTFVPFPPDRARAQLDDRYTWRGH